MRVFICNGTGSGTSLLVDLDPADWYADEDGNTVTTTIVEDHFRPNVIITGPYWADELQQRAAGIKFLVLARDVVGPLANTYDLGDPTDPADMNRALTPPERNAAENYFGEPKKTFDGFTVGGIFLWAKADGVLLNLPGWAGDLPVTEVPPVTNPRLP